MGAVLAGDLLTLFFLGADGDQLGAGDLRRGRDAYPAAMRT
ncbi:MAG: hypothetical protein R3E34_03415 [Rhodocyclaceae bacterium]